MAIFDELHFNDKGLIPTVVQDEASGTVLTLCYMNKEAIEKSLSEGKVYVFRRSKNRLMLKGETSGCIQIIKSVYADCANNSLLFKVDQHRAGCHEGYFTCYFTKIDKDGTSKAVGERVFDPEDVYGKK